MSNLTKPVRKSSKRRINEIDDTIENLTHAVQNLTDFVFKSEIECSMMTAKLKREKIKALSVVAKSQVILAEMEVLIAESDLYSDLERLKNNKKIKLIRSEGKHHQSTPRNSTHAVRVSSTKTKSRSSQVQPSTMPNPKKNSSSSLDMNSSIETVIVETINQNKTESVAEKSQLHTGISDIRNSDSDSIASLSSSIKTELNNAYQNNTTDSKSKSFIKTHSSDNKTKSKHNLSPSISTRTVSEINKVYSSKQTSLSKNSRPKTQLEPKSEMKSVARTCTFVPIRHNNLPMIITQDKPLSLHPSYTTTSVINPELYINTTSNIALSSRSYGFYGSRQ